MADFTALFGAPSARPPPRPSAPPPEAAPPSKKRKRQKGKKPAASGEPSAAAAAAAPAKKSAGDAARAQLAGARFRHINELLYTQGSAESVALFEREPGFFDAYHEGFRLQAARWPVNPVHLVTRWLRAQPETWVVGDLGCGDAALARSVPHRVHSFDLVANNERVTACDIARLPLADRSLDVAVFCLALMGSNYVDFLREARRVLKPRALLKIAEVSSRFANLPAWLAMLDGLGFELLDRDGSNSHFLLFTFRKRAAAPPPAPIAAVPLKPCIYKRR